MYGVDMGKIVGENGDGMEGLVVLEEVMGRSGGRKDIERGEDGVVGEVGVELELDIRSRFEVLKDELVDFGRGMYKGGRKDGEGRRGLNVGGRLWMW